MKWLFSYVKKYIWALLGIFLGIFGFIMTELGLPYLLSQMVDRGIIAKNISFIQQAFIGMLLLTVIGVSLSIILEFSLASLASRVTQEIRQTLFEKMTQLSLLDYQKWGEASLLTRLGNDPMQIFNFLRMVLNAGLTAPLMFMSSMYLIYRFNSHLSVYVLLSLPLLLLGVFLLAKYSGPLSQKMQGALDQMNERIQEKLYGLAVIRSLNAQEIFSDRFAQANERYRSNYLTLSLVMAVAFPAFNLLFNALFALILWVGSHLIGEGVLEIGSLMAIIEYIFHALFSMVLFCSMFMMYPRAKTSLDRMQEVLAEPSERQEGELLKEPIFSLELCQAHLRYAKQEVPSLKKIDFKAKAGQKIAFVGSIGSGKSSVLKVLDTLYPLRKGLYFINGHPLTFWSLASVRQKIAYVPQESQLFKGSIAANLRLGNAQATDADLWEALTLAQAKSFVLEKGLYSEVEEGGANFSGGQRQRLAIAQALVKKADVYLFDDSFSALDVETERKIHATLNQYLQHALVVIASHRKESIQDADQIYVFAKGEVVAKGTHANLSQSCQLYQELTQEEDAQ